MKGRTMAKGKKRDDVGSDPAEFAAMVTRMMSDIEDDPVRLKRRLSSALEAEARLKAAEIVHDEARQKQREALKKLNGCREELHRILWNGPDPQTVMPFAAGEEGAGDDVNGEAVAAPKAKRVRNRTKDGAPKRVRKR